MSTYYLGIDPGVGGAYALVDSAGAVVACNPFVDWSLVHDNLHTYRREIRTCTIEKVHSVSGQGVKSVFTFGMNYGGWLALLEVYRISHSLIPPNRWQKMFLGSFPKGESKKRSLDFVKRKYPHVGLKKSEHGISDAICLALYALVMDRRMHKIPSSQTSNWSSTD